MPLLSQTSWSQPILTASFVIPKEIQLCVKYQFLITSGKQKKHVYIKELKGTEDAWQEKHAVLIIGLLSREKQTMKSLSAYSHDESFKMPVRPSVNQYTI